MKKKSKPNRRSLVIYKSYNFVDKDPVIDVARTLVQRSNRTYNQIHDAGGPTPSCLHQWFDGKTKRPQFCTLAATIRAVGGKMAIIDPQGSVMDIHPPPSKRR